MYGFRDLDHAAVLANLTDMGINQVFLSLGDTVAHQKLDPSNVNYDIEYATAMQEFISSANGLGIAVHAMTLEDPAFAFTTTRAAPGHSGGLPSLGRGDQVQADLAHCLDSPLLNHLILPRRSPYDFRDFGIREVLELSTITAFLTNAYT